MTTTAADPTAARLLALADHLELEGLATRLGRWLDDGLWDDAPALFTGDVAVRTPGGEARGITAVTDQARRNHDGLVRQHVIANVVVRFCEPGSPAPFFEAGKRYAWEAARTRAGWRLARITIEPRWQVGQAPRPVPAVAVTR